MDIIYEQLNESHYKGVIELEAFLWGGDNNYRTAMFNWKYVDNPFPNKLTGAVAICNGQIVGFRGLVPNYWNYQNYNIKNVHYTDAIVHPEFRGHNILAKLNLFLTKLYKEVFDYIIVLLPNPISGKIYRSQGLKQFSKATFYKKFVLFPPKKIALKQINSIDEIWKIIVSCKKTTEDSIQFNLTKEYFNWKIKEPNKNFVFIVNENPKSFCYTLVERRTKNIDVFDFGFQNTMNDVLDLLNYYTYTQKKKYINFPLYENKNHLILPYLKKAGYKTFSWICNFKKNYTYSKDLLIGPFNNKHNQESIAFDKLNIYMAKSWNFKHLFYV
jgi:hypothetical protein